MWGTALKGVASLNQALLTNQRNEVECRALVDTLAVLTPLLRDMTTDEKFADLQLHINKRLAETQRLIESFSEQSWIIKMFSAKTFRLEVCAAQQALDRAASFFTAAKAKHIENQLLQQRELLDVLAQGGQISAVGKQEEKKDDEKQRDEEKQRKDEIEDIFLKQLRFVVAHAFSELQQLSLGTISSSVNMGGSEVQLHLGEVVLTSFHTNPDEIQSFASDKELKFVFKRVKCTSETFNWSARPPEGPLNLLANFTDMSGRCQMTAEAFLYVAFSVDLNEDGQAVFLLSSCDATVTRVSLASVGNDMFTNIVNAALEGPNTQAQLCQAATAELHHKVESEFAPDLNQTLKDNSDNVLEATRAMIDQLLKQREQQQKEQEKAQAEAKQAAQRDQELRDREARLKQLQRGEEELYEYQRWFPIKGWTARGFGDFLFSSKTTLQQGSALLEELPLSSSSSSSSSSRYGRSIKR